MEQREHSSGRQDSDSIEACRDRVVKTGRSLEDRRWGDATGELQFSSEENLDFLTRLRPETGGKSVLRGY